MPKLKPCPFCGGKAMLFHIPQNDEPELRMHPKWIWKNPGWWLVGCNGDLCLANINNYAMVCPDDDSAIRAWNRMADDGVH